ncbi:MAG: hypothetical protein V4568_03645 [Pseudomonadota bacterium]
MKSLEILEARGNQLPVHAAASIGVLKELRRLDVSNNEHFFEVYEGPLRDIHAVDELIKLEKLSHLGVSKTGLVDDEMRDLLKRGENSYLPKLRHLHASRNQVTEAIVPTLQGHASLREVSLRDNPSITEETVKNMALSMPGLRKLNGRGIENGVLAPDFTAKSQASAAQTGPATSRSSRGGR